MYPGWLAAAGDDRNPAISSHRRGWSPACVSEEPPRGTSGRALPSDPWWPGWST